MEGLQEVLCVDGVAASVKQQPVLQSWSTDHVHSTHFSGPVSNHGVVLTLDHRGGGGNLSRSDDVLYIFYNLVIYLKRTRIVPILIPGKSSLLGGVFHSNLASSSQNSVPTSPIRPWHQHSYTIICTVTQSQR